MFVFLETINFSVRSLEQIQLLTLERIHRVVSSVAVAALCFLVLVKRRYLSRSSIYVFMPFLLYLTFQLFSTLLNGTQIFYNMYKLLELFGVTLLSITLYEMTSLELEDFERILQFIIGFYKVLIIAVILNLILFPKICIIWLKSPFPLINSIYPAINSNSVGFLSVSIFTNEIFSKWDGMVRRFSKAMWIILSMIVMFFAQSRTSIISFLCVLILWIRENLKPRSSLLLSVIVALILFSVLREDFIEYFKRGQTEQQLETLSGRTLQWGYALQSVLKSDLTQILFGTGGKWGSVILMAEFHGVNMITDLHSDYFGVFVSSGLMGFICFILFLIISLVVIFRTKYSLIIGLAIVILIRTLTGSVISSLHFGTIIYFVLLSYAMRLRDNKKTFNNKFHEAQTPV